MPRNLGILLGLSNTTGVLAGVFGTAATGYMCSMKEVFLMMLNQENVLNKQVKWSLGGTKISYRAVFDPYGR
ncbi:hypothetical protein V2J09_004550 [Rumex salicifolius]